MKKSRHNKTMRDEMKEMEKRIDSIYSHKPSRKYVYVAVVVLVVIMIIFLINVFVDSSRVSKESVPSSGGDKEPVHVFNTSIPSNYEPINNSAYGNLAQVIADNMPSFIIMMVLVMFAYMLMRPILDMFRDGGEY